MLNISTTMKKFNIILGFTLAVVFMASCAKDTKQIMRSWIVNSVTVDGADSSSAWKKNQYIETYGDGGVYSFSGDPQNRKGEGDYQFTAGNRVKRSGVSNQASVEFTIIKCTRKVLEYEYTYGGKKYIFKFSKY